MSMATFSGPIRAGTQRYGSAANVGVVELVQFASITSAQILTAPAAVTIATLPAGSKITSIDVDVTTALVTATNCGITIGLSGGSASYFCATFNTGTTAVRVSPATIAAAMVGSTCDNVGTSDVVVTATPTAATSNATAGAITITIKYIQRNSDGTVTVTA